MSEFRPFRVLHLSLEVDFPSLPSEPERGGIYVVLWLAEVPVGHLVISAAQLPVSADELRRLASQVVTPSIGDRLFSDGFRSVPKDVPYADEECAPVVLDELLACEHPLASFRRMAFAHDQQARAATCPTVSVIICTRDRPRELERCLASLIRSTRRADEIIVVDNAPSTAETRQVADVHPAVRYVLESRPGLSIARNTGIRTARGEVIAFTDDDVEVHADWISRLAQAFGETDVLALTGLVLPAELKAESQWLFETEFGGFSQGYRRLLFDTDFFSRTRKRGVPAWRIGTGANMAFRRAAFEEVGLFHELLGVGAAGCSEDSELWYRLLARGWKCRYDPAVVVFHHHRSDMPGLHRQMNAYMKGHVATLLLQAERHRDAGNLYRLAVTLPWHYLKKGVYGLVFGFDGRHRTIPAEIRGCFAGIKFYLQHRRAAPDAIRHLQRAE